MAQNKQKKKPGKLKTETRVNGQIVGAVAASSVQVLASAPAVAMGNLYNTMANSVAMSAINAVYAQQQANITHQAVTAKSVALLLGD